MVAVIEGQADIQQHQLGVKGREFPQHIAEIPGAAGLIAPGPQLPGHGGGDHPIVLYDKDLHFLTPFGFSHGSYYIIRLSEFNRCGIL